MHLNVGGMVSPSKTKYSRVAANQQQKTATNKVKLVKGPRPLIYHRFYLDIQKHQLASEIESTIKELGGTIEFFLNKEITHFITDKHYQQQSRQQQHPQRATESDGGPSSQQLQQPVTPKTPRTPLSYAYHPHLQQYLNEASPSSPCVAGTPNPTPSASGSAAIKPTLPRSRADAMLQRVRQQQQQQQRNSSNYPTSAPPSSPCSPAPTSHNTFRTQLDRTTELQSPAHLAKSWGKPIWTTEYAIKFFKKVIETCRGGDLDPQQSLGKSGTGRPSATTSDTQRKAANIQHLRGDFLKIESYQRNYRPAFQLFKKWPVLNLNTRSSASPFNTDRDRHGGAAGKSVKTATATTNHPKTTTTHATTNTNARAKATQQQQRCGYCEICRIEYDVLANHLAAEEHSAFVKNDANFVSLDKLISDGGVDLKTFLSENQTFAEEEEEEKESGESAKRDAESETVIGVKNIVLECKAEEEQEEPSEKRKKEDKDEENSRIREQVEPSRQQSPKAVKTYSRKFKDKNRINCATEDPGSHGSSARTPPAKRTYAGRKQARRAAQSAPAPAQSLAPPVEPPDDEHPRQPAGSDDSVPPEPPKSPKDAAEAQMFGRRSAIHHHPHNTLNHHNHQKVKAARQLQQQTILNLNSIVVTVPVPSTVIVPKPPADEMKVLDNEPINNGPSEKEKEKDRQSKRGAADRMGLKGSSLKPTVVHHPVEMLECEGLDPKNTKRISLGLRQNPKRANLNEDFTSLLDETLGPMRKPRVRRESAKRVNYSEPREDEIASQEEIMQSILEKTAKEASENESKKKKSGSPKRPLDVKIRGIQWRAPSPQARPPVKSPLLYKVIEEPKPKNKKTASPTKEPKEGGSHSKSNKNGLIVKIRRVRQSELSLLNDEAENFMFPKKDDSSDEQTDEDRHTTSEMEPAEMSQELPSSEPDHRNSLSMRKQASTPSGRKRTTSMKLLQSESPNKKAAKDSDQEATPRSRRGGVRGPAALLQDNAEYYKFPDPGSRLRFPEAPIQPNPAEVEDDTHRADVAGKQPSSSKARGKRCRAKTPAPATMTSSSQKQHEHDLLLATRSSPSSPYQHQEQLSNCGKNIINYVKGKEDGMGVFRWSNFRKNCKEIEPYRFAFERVPSLEPWYETFQRQDDCTEIMYQYFGNTAYRKLPYEMGPLPPLKQNCCILNYRLKSKTPETAIPVSSASSCSSSSTSSTCGGLNAATTTANSAIAIVGYDDKQSLALPLKKRKLLVDSDRPRKSPREHASTLAILSLLHQQQQHNRRRTISGCSSVPIVTTNLPPPSPTPSAYSPKKAAIQAHHNSNQEADSALGDEIRSSCGSDPVTEKEDHGGKKIKFDPPVMVDTFVNYKAMCQELDDFLSNVGSDMDESLFGLRKKTVPIGLKQPLKQNLVDIVRTCDKEPPLTLKQVSRHESIVRKIVQYDRKPRPLSAISIKSFDGGGVGGGLGLFRKRINRTGWPNVKKRIVTRKQQQQQQMKVKKEDESGVKKENGESGIVVDAEGSRKSSTEESQISALTEDTSLVKQENEELEDDDDEDEFEDTMTMLDDEEPNEKVDTILTEDEAEEPEEVDTPKKVERGKTPLPSKVEETITRSVSRLGNRVLPSSKYVTKTTTTMTRVDYNVLPSSSSSTTIATNPSNEVLPVPNHTTIGKGNKPTTTNNNISCPAAVTAEEDDKECDSISSRSIFVSDDCDTTSSTLINMQCTEDPLAILPGSQRNSSATPQPATTEAQVEPPAPPPETQPQLTRQSRPASRARQNTTRHLSYGASGPPTKRKSDALHPVVCLEKLNCQSTMRTRSSSRTPVKKTYKRSIFTSALVNSSGKPLKKKRKKKNKHKLNGVSSEASIGSPSPSCSEELNSASSSLECDDSTILTACDTPTQLDRKSIKDRPPTPGPIKHSPRKLRKPRGRWYRER